MRDDAAWLVTDIQEILHKPSHPSSLRARRHNVARSEGEPHECGE
jgi:hypothetical protein